MAREYTPEELGLAPVAGQKEYTPAELGLQKPDALGRYIAAPGEKETKQKEYTPEELGLGPKEKEATVASQLVGGVKQAGADSVSYTHLTLPTKRIV